MSLFSTQPVVPQLQAPQQPPAQNLGFSAQPQGISADPMNVTSFAQQAAYGGGSGGLGASHSQGVKDMLAKHAHEVMTAVLGGLF